MWLKIVIKIFSLKERYNPIPVPAQKSKNYLQLPKWLFFKNLKKLNIFPLNKCSRFLYPLQISGHLSLLIWHIFNKTWCLKLNMALRNSDSHQTQRDRSQVPSPGTLNLGIAASGSLSIPGNHCTSLANCKYFSQLHRDFFHVNNWQAMSPPVLLEFFFNVNTQLDIELY